ncbi:hypothetical protein [Gordonia aurantiaca]|uniref:hypothetical protein n=1 Tax=Gordonia sp. B21 TaxID=3151852 RepID=UPI0032662D84
MATDTTTRDEIDTVATDLEDAGESTAAAAKSTARSAPLGRKPSRGRARRDREHPASTSTGPRRTALLAGVLAVLLAVATGLAAFFGYQYATDDAAGSSASDSQVLDIAKDYAVKLSSFDYRDLDANREAITAMSTKDFAEKYSEMVRALTQIVTDGKGEATAEVTHAAVEGNDGTTATVLLFVDQKARNVVAPDGKTQPYRMVVTLKHSDGRWLVDNVETK